MKRQSGSEVTPPELREALQRIKEAAVEQARILIEDFYPDVEHDESEDGDESWDLQSDIGTALSDALISVVERNRGGKPANVVDALYAISYQLADVAYGLHQLGVKGASTPYGAIEALSMSLEQSGERISSSLSEISASLDGIRISVEEKPHE